MTADLPHPLPPSVQKFHRLLEKLRTCPVEEKVVNVNLFFNAQIEFATDSTNYGVSDYWAPLMKTLTKGAGDCEDFAIAKYTTLVELDVEDVKLAHMKTPFGSHMVCMWGDRVLDNRIDEILPLAECSGMELIFTFDDELVYLAGKSYNADAALKQWPTVKKESKCS